MADWFPFQDVPGLLTPEMSNNVRTGSLLSAAAGLLNSAGWSDKPVNMWQALGAGVQGGLQGYEQGQQQAVRMTLLREQAEKLAEARRQAAQWAQIFGIPGATSPSTAMASLPTGPTAAPQATPAMSTARPPVQPTGKVWGDQEAIDAGLYDQPAGLLTPGSVPMPRPRPAEAPAFDPARASAPLPPASSPSVPTQRDVRVSANDGLRAAVAAMPQGMREMIAIAGPEKGREILAQWIGKKAEKPSDTFITVESADGRMTPYRADSPELDTALRQPGALVVTTPSSRMQTTTTTLRMTDGSLKTFRQSDPAIDDAIARGAVEVSKPSSDPKDHKPDNYALPDGRTVLSVDGKSYKDPQTGQWNDMPPDAVRLGSESGYEASRQNAVRGRARNELGGAFTDRPPAEVPTIKGTGLWSYAQSLSNDVAGGAGLDLAFGKNGLFRENEANRNYLLNLRQVAKTALVNNPRFPVAEQKNVDAMFPDPDKMWRNPRTEVDKIPLLRNTLEEQLRTNNEAIAAGALSKEEVSRLSSNNIETRRALRMLGYGDASLKVLGDTSNTAPPARPSVPTVGGPPVPGARKAPDGQWYTPDPKRPGKYLRVSAIEADDAA